MLKKTIFINGIERRVVVDPEVTLASMLRNQLFLTGTKMGCGKGECGACTVIINDKAEKSCSIQMKSVPEDARIITIEGIGTKQCLHPLQLAWIIHGAAHCGFCTPGFIVSSKALLDENINPSKEDVINWFQKNQNVCSCIGYDPIVDAVMDAAKIIRGDASKEELWTKLKDGTKTLDSVLADSLEVAKVTGTLEFGTDLGLKLPEGTMQIKLVQAQVSNANILSIDTSEAEKMQGVYKVITYKDVPGTNRINGYGKEKPILNDKKVYQRGDAIAMVLAYTAKDAEAAAKMVKIKMEELPASGSAEKNDEAISHGQDAGFAYVDEKGKLIIHSNSVEHLHALAEGIGMPLEKLAVLQNPTRSNAASQCSPIMEGLLGVAALVAKKPVYLEL